MRRSAGGRRGSSRLLSNLQAAWHTMLGLEPLTSWYITCQSIFMIWGIVISIAVNLQDKQAIQVFRSAQVRPRTHELPSSTIRFQKSIVFGDSQVDEEEDLHGDRVIVEKSSTPKVCFESWFRVRSWQKIAARAPIRCNKRVDTKNGEGCSIQISSELQLTVLEFRCRRLGYR